MCVNFQFIHIDNGCHAIVISVRIDSPIAKKAQRRKGPCCLKTCHPRPLLPLADRFIAASAVVYGLTLTPHKGV
jgi:hypothetical protein